jgi:hypothetical protein
MIENKNIQSEEPIKDLMGGLVVRLDTTTINSILKDLNSGVGDTSGESKSKE